MVKLTRIYTKTGDKGKTSLVSGKRVSKDNIRIRAYGTVDELNSILGVVKHHVSKKLIKVIAEIQNDLFDLGADIATPETDKPALRITSEQVTRLET
jgi:cob(I)alamin adenosyltransferase